MPTPLPRALALAMAVGALSTVPLAAMSPATAAAVDYTSVTINEVNSDLAPGDWIELVNTGDVEVDLSGVVVKDNDDTRTDALAQGTTIAAGGFLLLSTGAEFSYGLGRGDSARIFEPGGTTLIDGYTWPAETHAATNGRCADGTGEFVIGLEPTPGAANDCPVPQGRIVLNEVKSNPNPDFVELYNAGDAPVDINGWKVLDDDPTHVAAPIASTETPIAPGEFYSFTPDTLAGGFGLGGNDAVTIFEADGATVVDTFTWEGIGAPGDHANPSYGRCPDGTGEMVLQSTATPGAANECATFDPADVRLNEVESNGDPVADWVELVNTGDSPADISDWRLKDSGATNPFVVIPAGTVIQPGGFFATYTEFPPPGFGLGVDETISLFQADGTSLVDSHSWTGGHAGTTFGRCPDGVGAWQETTVSTRGTANACSPIRINEILSDPNPDWVELVNLSGADIDVAGWVIKDSTDTNPTTLPSPSVVPANGHLLISSLAAGLGSADGVRLFDPTARLIDSHSWTAHGIPSYGRCTDGVGAFALTAVVTPGAVNDCPGLETRAWPGSQTVAVSDDAATFIQDASGVVFDPADANTLWVAQNKAGTLWRMTRSGDTWVPAAGWAGGRNPRYADGTGAPDSEGITIGPDGAVYLATERDNSVSGVSKNAVLRYEPGTSTGGTSTSADPLRATDEWSLNALLPTLGANLGLEGITWVPDSHLTTGGFVDESTSASYDPADYPNHGDGLYVVAVEGTGLLYVVALEQTAAVQEQAHLVATLDPQLATNAGPPGAMDVTWDPEQERLWALCDDSCDGVSVTLALDDAGAFGVTAAYDRPLGMPNLNNEGMALAPPSTCIGGSKEVVWADDGDTDGHSLRSGTIDCEAAPTTPMTPTTPVAPVIPVIPVTPTPTTATPVVAKKSARITTRGTVRGSVGERIRVRLRVTAGGDPATGWVKVRVKGKAGSRKVRLATGRAVVRLPRFARAGSKRIVLTYLGNATTSRDTQRIRAVIRA